MSAQIFISYRRSDGGGHAGRLHDRLAHWFDAGALFYDTAAIAPGQTFPQRLADAVAASKVILVVIGPDWISEINRRAGLPETDYVRREVAHALRRQASPGGPTVIPILLGGAAAPSIHDLHPSLHEDIAGLCAVNMYAFHGSDADWESQFVRLRGLIAAVPGVPPPRFRVPAGAEQPFRVIEHSLSRHFSDPEDKLGEIARALGAPAAAAAVPAAAIHGMGGVGKTQLALKYSHEHRDRYAAVWWLRAETDDSLQRDALGCCRAAGVPTTDGEPPAAALKRWLEGIAREQAWLLVFDNAEDPAALRRWLPDRGGHHVLITSRNPAWSGIAQPVAMAVWTSEQGADFLARRLPDTHPSRGERAALAELSSALGGLPLALEQAGGYLDATASTAATYANLLRSQDAAPVLLDEGRVASGYERSVLATLSIAFPRLDGPTAQLLRLLAFCAPDPVPERLFVGQVNALPQPLADAARDPMQWHKAVAALRAFGLAERALIPGPDDQPEPALMLHRLTQEVARRRHVSARSQAADTLLGLIALALPHDAASPSHWRIYASLAPHALNIDRLTRCAQPAPRGGQGNLGRPGVSLRVEVDRRRLVWVLDRMATYLAAGPSLYAESRRVFERAWTINREDLGEADPNTLVSMFNLAGTMREQGDLSAARALLEQVLHARRRMRGETHPETLRAMHSLADILHKQGDLPAARALLEQVLDARRPVLGDAHPDTLVSMGNLAGILHTQGDLLAARALYERVLDGRRNVLGEAHPDTLTAVNALAVMLHDQGDLATARVMHEQVLAGLRRVLGDSHPTTLSAMSNLAATLRRQGERSAARELEEKMVAAQRRVLGDSHPDTLMSMRNVSYALWEDGHPADAIELLQQAVSAGSKALGTAHPWVQRIAAILAQMQAHPRPVLTTVSPTLQSFVADTVRQPR